MIELVTENELRAYINAKLFSRGGPSEGGFLHAFLTACLRADSDNWALLRPALTIIARKYPAFPEDLEKELDDFGH